MRAFYGSRISENMRLREPEGYLICMNVPIARTGSQVYLKKELEIPGEGTIQVVREPEEVFSPAAMASFEGLPVCDDHPYDDVDIGNVTAYGKGHVQNVRRGQPPEDDLLIADLVITHKDLIDQIMTGKREVSCGYHCNYEEGPDGNIYQRAIRGNHVAIVKDGRAGGRVAIRDSAPEKILERGYPKMEKAKKTPSFFARAVAKFVRDAEPEEGAIAIDEMLENGAEEEAPAAAPAPVAQGAAARKDAAAPVPAAMPPAQQPQDADPEMTAPEAVQDEGGDPMAEMLAILRELKGALIKPKAEPLDALEMELKGEKPTDADATEAVTVEPEDIQDADETVGIEEEVTDADEVVEAEEEETTDGCSTKDSRAALLSVLKDMKPVVASLPAAQRKKVSDSMAAALRKAANVKSSNGENAKLLARMAGGRKVTNDSASAAPEFDYGKFLNDKYNLHNKK